MFRREIPVYLFTGFLESGKSSFILDTLSQDYFATGEKTLILACEEGTIEYNLNELRNQNVYVEFVHEEDELTTDFLKKIDAKHKPKRVIIEYNGMWNVESVLEDVYPASWALTQVISTVEYPTFSMFWNNMRSLVINQLSMSDMIIFNRCDGTTNRNELRRNMKLFNKKAQVAYDWVEGFDGSTLVEEMPYDINADELVVEDDDYGFFYMDAMENPEKYAEKTVKLNCVFHRPRKYSMNQFVLGRFAMTCCADDIAYLGLLSESNNDVDYEERQWLSVTAKIKVRYVKEYKDMGPVLEIIDIKEAERPDDDLVYFN